jgi:hypothetical protein
VVATYDRRSSICRHPVPACAAQCHNELIVIDNLSVGSGKAAVREAVAAETGRPVRYLTDLDPTWLPQQSWLRGSQGSLAGLHRRRREIADP